jgi:hypothetical protein
MTRPFSADDESDGLRMICQMVQTNRFDLAIGCSHYLELPITIRDSLPVFWDHAGVVKHVSRDRFIIVSLG